MPAASISAAGKTLFNGDDQVSNNEYYINDKNEFVIEDYNRKKPFSSFLPAVSGLYGKPLWAYYVNRGQCIASFGVNNKDHSIMEFQPANKAYRQTALQCFRTFLKVTEKDGSQFVYEPFRDNTGNPKIKQTMRITSYDFKIEDINLSLGIKTTVMFCTLPNEKLPALMRTVKFENIGKEPLVIEALDGMPVIIPYYLINSDMKNESNLRQAWMSADLIEGLPFYRIKALPYDTPETVLLEGGNFYLNLAFENEAVKPSPAITDPTLVFGNGTDLEFPHEFIKKEFTVPKHQVSVGYTPCAFTHQSFTLLPGTQHKEYVLSGSAQCSEDYLDFVKRINYDYLNEKINENKNLIEHTKRHIFTSSAVKEFDLYCGQTFMDNYLRGGYPIAKGKGKHTLYVYSRKHGDLEREYNFFQVDATNYSQGNANFRDVNQNRRNDVYFFPFIEDTGLTTFFQLIQLDGFNPLVLNGSVFKPQDADACSKVLSKYLSAEEAKAVSAMIVNGFTPGRLLLQIEQNGILLSSDKYDDFINELLFYCEKEEQAVFQEGYWVDHWTYNNDLLEQFMQVYPDKAAYTVFEQKNYTFYDNDAIVMPRHKKYMLTDNGVRQYGAVKKNEEKSDMIAKRSGSKNTVRADYGKGGIYKTTLAAKIFSLLINKSASLDPQGIGIEMESDKPGWCDALNGLPGILGSSINESAELLRLAVIMEDLLKHSANTSIWLAEELYEFMQDLLPLLLSSESNMEYWEKANTVKEAYREKVLFGVSGTEKRVSYEEAVKFVKAVSRKIESGLQRAKDSTSGVYHTYYINEALEYEKAAEQNGKTFVHVKKFKGRPIPPFLEGQVHMMRVDKNQAASIHRAVKKSGIYDEKLDMFKVNANIMEETKEIGRQNIFPRGWLENEAVFLHMEYKYFLELLRADLYEEFFHYLKTAFIPFLDPAVYGRSTLENCSFIVSSAHPDKRLHGSGYVSRLTGATTEFLHIWRLMTAGENVFSVNEAGELSMSLTPKLPEWLFTTEEKKLFLPGNAETAVTQPKNTFMCTLLGEIPLVYHNSKRLSTYENGVAVVEMTLIKKNGEKKHIIGNTVSGVLAKEIRDNEVKQIDAVIDICKNSNEEGHI